MLDVMLAIRRFYKMSHVVEKPMYPIIRIEPIPAPSHPCIYLYFQLQYT